MDLETLFAVKGVIIFGAWAVFALAERWRPAADGPLLLRWGQATAAAWRRTGRNLTLFAINLALGPLIVVPITLWATGFSLGLRPLWWSGWAGLLLDILLLDLWIYWWHRANHVVPVLWRFHAVHHLDETLDTTTAFRFHAGEVALSALVRAVVIVLFDLPLASVILFEALVQASAIFHHSDTRLPKHLERALSRVIITPSIHWVHHHARRADTDSNYGTIFSFWDPLFASRSRTRRILGMPIGVESLEDVPLPALLVRPFVAQPRANAAPASARQ
jgi:sterol desaturase/sphingolipid hydroxylase (fatty acid hydroxylase superfamily)